MLYAKLIFIFISENIVNFSRNLLRLHGRREASGPEAANELVVIADKWLESVILHPENVKQSLNGAIRFIMKHCFKIPQKDRVYPLELPDKMLDKEIATD